MSHQSTQDDLRNTRLYELLAYLKPKQRKIVAAIAAIELIPIDSKKNSILEAIIAHIDSKKNTILTKSSLMEKSGISAPLAFNYATSDLFKMVCKMLYLLNVRKDNAPDYTLSLTNFFIENELSTNVFHSLKELKSNLYKKKIAAYELPLYKMEYHKLNLARTKDRRKAEDEHFKATNLNLDAFYAENKLHLLCEGVNRKRIVQENTILKNTSSEKFLLLLIKENDYFKSPFIECYFYIYQMLSSNETAAYQLAVDKINKYQEQLSPDMEETFIVYFMNQCIYFMNKNIDRIAYANQYIQYIDLLEEKDYLFTNNQLAPSRFQGIVIAGVIAKQMQWATDFVNQKVKKLNSAHEEFIKQIHLAYIAFHSNDLDLASKIINTADNYGNVDPFFAIFYHKLIIQIFVSQQEWELAEYKIAAFYKYIGRKDKKNIIAPDKIQSLRNFTSILSKFIKIKQNPNTQPSDYKKLQEYLKKNKGNIAYSEWIEQIIKP